MVRSCVEVGGDVTYGTTSRVKVGLEEEAEVRSESAALDLEQPGWWNNVRIGNFGSVGMDIIRGIPR